MNMINATSPQLVLRSGLALGLALGIWFTGPVPTATAADMKMMDHCQAMQAQRQKMQTDMQAQADQLAAKLETMERAPREEKLELLASVVTLMAQQQSTRNAHQAKMEESMMKHMMEHMEMGKESLTQCPLMKGMGASKGHAGEKK
jgi:hypothetical protein